MKKRIVIIAEYFPPRLGGDRRIFELMKRLSRKYDIHFITLPPSYTLFIRKIESYRKEENDQVFCEGMTGHRLNLPKLLWKLWTRSFLFPFALTLTYFSFQITKKIAELKPEIIIINNTSVYTGLLGFVASRILSKKLLVEYNDLEALYAIGLVEKKLNPFLLAILGRMLVLIEDTIVRHGWKVTAITEFIKNYANTRGTRKDVKVIPDGVDTDFFDPAKNSGVQIRSKYGLSDKDNLCVYAGRIEESAGVNIILGTVQLLEKEDTVRFMIVGEGDQQLVNKLAGCSNVILTGRVPKENIPEYLAAADIVLVPFPDSIASHSVSPLKLFEALAMNKPIIASAVSGIKEVVSENFNGVLVSARPKEWASAVLELSKDNNINREINNRKIVRSKYDWNYLAEELDRIIDTDISAV